ncbi:MAG: protein translocase subunit SecF [Clostridia bacterium]|nr:protein translocase subunit SecF [Clostridia bacterium]MBO7289097.1 protein translocase subunit SecF [Clostridia bacterium]
MFNIIEKRKILFLIPCVIVLAGIITLIVFGGLNTDIDFTGGTAMEIELGKEFNENQIRDAIGSVKDVKISSVQSSGSDKAIVKTAELPHETLVKVQDAVKKSFPESNIISVDSVSATMGREMWWSAAKAIGLAVVLMLAYIWFRFELYSGLAAVIALCHDVLVIISIYAIFRFPVNSTFIAAVLTILGYSINATIVVFDRVRENMKLNRKASFDEVVNASIWQTLARSINTSVTTLLTLICLYILGVTSIKQFALPLVIGVVSGTFSSVFIAGPVWALLKGNKK